MVDADTIYVAVGSVTLLGGLAVWRNSVARHTHKVMVEEPAQERRRLETIIDGTTIIGTLERVYQNGNGYRDQQGQNIQISSVGSNVLRIDPVKSSHARGYFGEKLGIIKEMGTELQAHYFSLTEPSYVNRFLLYSSSD